MHNSISISTNNDNAQEVASSSKIFIAARVFYLPVRRAWKVERFIGWSGLNE
jgi:hypothetical protein